MRELDRTLNHGQDKTCLRNILDISSEGEKIDSISYGANLTLTDLNHDNQKEYMINYACGAQNECRYLYTQRPCFKLIGEFLGTEFKPRARTIGKAGAYTDIWFVTSGGYCGYGAWYKLMEQCMHPLEKAAKLVVMKMNSTATNKFLGEHPNTLKAKAKGKVTAHRGSEPQP